MCVHMHVLTLCCALEPSQALELFATLGEATGVQGDGNLNVVLDLRGHYSHGQPQKIRNSQYFFFCCCLNLTMGGLGGEEGYKRGTWM